MYRSSTPQAHPRLSSISSFIHSTCLPTGSPYSDTSIFHILIHSVTHPHPFSSLPFIHSTRVHPRLHYFLLHPFHLLTHGIPLLTYIHLPLHLFYSYIHPHTFIHSVDTAHLPYSSSSLIHLLSHPPFHLPIHPAEAHSSTA